MDTIGIWSEKCRRQHNQQPATRYKVCKFFKNNKALCITTGILFLPLGIAYATTYGVAKGLVKHSEKLDKRATSVDLQNENPQPLTSKMILQINLGSSAIDFLTDQNLIDYANSTNVRLEEPSSPLQRNKIAFTCCTLSDEQLTKIINDENIPREYKEIAYCIGTMRKMLEQCSSEELLTALQNSKMPTCTFNGSTFHATNLESKQNTQELYWTETIKKVFATEEEATYEYNEFWNEYRDFNRALLQQMIAIELRTKQQHQQFHKDNKSAIDSFAKTAAFGLTMYRTQY